MNEFIPIHQYAKLKNTKIQNVYRWIREHKFKEEDIKLEEVLVKRIRINKNAICK